jgi:hypothetical protein
MRTHVGVEGSPAHRFPSNILIESKPYKVEDPANDEMVVIATRYCL